MPRTTKFGKQATTKESYADGFATGKTWACNYVPGGPFVYSDPYARDPEWIAYCRQSATNREQYMLGFHAGFATQVRVA